MVGPWRRAPPGFSGAYQWLTPPLALEQVLMRHRLRRGAVNTPRPSQDHATVSGSPCQLVSILVPWSDSLLAFSAE